MSDEQLQKILKPCPAEEFLASTWGREFRHVRGWAGKFADLLPWERLNEVLAQHRLDFPRLRLVRDGKPIPAGSYIRHTGGARRRATVPHLLPVGLLEHLRAGATLVLDAVDELQRPIQSLAEGLELLFGEHVQVNCYAGWQTSKGFDLHWDDHDVFILQVAGRKRWSVYGMTRPHPIQSDIERAARPVREPVWEATLEDGDLLYIPRGWWHVALPLAEPTLHLTVGVHKRTGVDLLRWLTERMRACELYRRDLPRLATPAERAAHAAALRQELIAAFDDTLVEQFLAEYDASAEPRAHLSLPWAATPRPQPLAPRTVVRFLPPRPLDFRVEAGIVEFTCLKRRWRFREEALAVLRPLEARRLCTVAELCEGARPALDERTVRALVGELLLQGLIAIVDA